MNPETPASITVNDDGTFKSHSELSIIPALAQTQCSKEPYWFESLGRGTFPEFELTFTFPFQNREEYLAWVKQWKSEYARHTAIARTARAFRKKVMWNSDKPEIQARLAGLHEATKLHFALPSIYNLNSSGRYPRDMASKARMLLAMRKAAKVQSWEMRNRSLQDGPSTAPAV